MQIRKKKEHKIDPSGAPKKTKQNKIRRCNNSYILTLSLFLAEVIYIFHDLKYKFSNLSTL